MNDISSPQAAFEAVPTEMVRLHPAFVAKLRQLAPRRRRSKIPYVIALGVAAVVVTLAFDPSVRELALRRTAAPTAPTPAVIAPGISAHETIELHLEEPRHIKDDMSKQRGVVKMKHRSR